MEEKEMEQQNENIASSEASETKAEGNVFGGPSGEEFETVEEGAKEQALEKAEASDGEWIIPGKFKTIEEVRKGFKETEKYLKKLEQERKELREVLEKVAPLLLEEKQGSGEQFSSEELKEKFLEAFEQDPIGVLSALLETAVEEKITPVITPLQQNYVVQRLQEIDEKVQAEFPEFDMHKNQQLVAEELKTYPEEFRYNYPELALRTAVMNVIKKLEKEGKLEQISKAKEEGAEQVKQKILGADTLTSKAKTGVKKSENDSILESILNAGSRRGVF